MPDTVSIIRSEGTPLSVEAERKQHSDWAKQEAQLMMDELFADLHDPFDADFEYESAAVDVDWVDGVLVNASPQTTSSAWATLNPNPSDPIEESHWITQANTTPFYRRLFLILGGLAVVTPLSFWGVTTLRDASQPRSVIAATPAPLETRKSVSDQDFAKYAERAFRQIEVQPPASQETAAALPPLTLVTNATSSDATYPSTVPMTQSVKPVPSASAASAQASPVEMDRLALRVFKPNKTVQSDIPALSGAQTETLVPVDRQLPAPPTPSAIAPAPASDLPTLAANIAAPGATVAAALPMSSPVGASKKVIGIVELGLQSTLMVSNNGSHLNFRVGDTVNEEGWKLVQIAQGKAILQKGTEYKTLSEGQYF